MKTQQDLGAMAQVARFLGELLLFEVDGPRLAQLREPPMSAALGELGIEVPEACGEDDVELEQLAADFFALILQPTEGAPPVQSVWDTGAFEGEPAACIRRHAEAAQVSFDRSAARGAAVDHLGSILVLWSELVQNPAGASFAEHLQSHHMDWGRRALARAGEIQGFYGQVTRACSAFVAEIGLEPEL